MCAQRDHSIPKGQPKRRPGNALRRYEQMGHEGGHAQPSGGGGYSKGRATKVSKVDRD